MADGLLLSPEYDSQIRASLTRGRRKARTSRELAPRERIRQASRFPSRAVILDAALSAVTNPKIPTSALATVCRWSVADELYVETDQQITVWNHSFRSFEQHSFGEASWIDGHPWFFGDCEPMDPADREGAEE